MKKKLLTIWKLFCSSKYIVIVDEPGTDQIHINYAMSSLDIKRYTAFLFNYLHESDPLVNEAQEIINQNK